MSTQNLTISPDIEDNHYCPHCKIEGVWHWTGYLEIACECPACGHLLAIICDVEVEDNG